MRNIFLISPKRLSREDIRRFIIDRGGDWQSDPTLDQGVIERGSAAVYISGDTELHSYLFEPDEIYELTRKIGSEPLSLVDIHISRGKASDTLADEIADQMLELWGGYIDQNRPLE